MTSINDLILEFRAKSFDLALQLNELNDDGSNITSASKYGKDMIIRKENTDNLLIRHNIERSVGDILCIVDKLCEHGLLSEDYINLKRSG